MGKSFGVVRIRINSLEYEVATFRKDQAYRDGRVFQGCNVENASYGLTLCAERTALGAAVAAGHRCFKAIAIVSSGKTAPTPCGACLQVLAEFCRPDCQIMLASATRPATFQTYRLKDLLPRAFKLSPR